jgi:hypothetical protein
MLSWCPKCWTLETIFFPAVESFSPGYCKAGDCNECRRLLRTIHAMLATIWRSAMYVAYTTWALVDNYLNLSDNTCLLHRHSIKWLFRFCILCLWMIIINSGIDNRCLSLLEFLKTKQGMFLNSYTIIMSICRLLHYKKIWDFHTAITTIGYAM